VTFYVCVQCENKIFWMKTFIMSCIYCHCRHFLPLHGHHSFSFEMIQIRQVPIDSSLHHLLMAWKNSTQTEKIPSFLRDLDVHLEMVNDQRTHHHCLDHTFALPENKWCESLRSNLFFWKMKLCLLFDQNKKEKWGKWQTLN
jgi:hypothetical protein